jgi:hypothetical protein
MPQHSPEVTRRVFALLAEGKSQGQASRQTGVPQPTISNWVKARRHTTGNPEHTNGIPAVYHDETSGIPPIHGIPSGETGIPDTRWRQTIESRLDVIESFIAAAQERTRGIPGIPDSIPGIPQSIPAIPSNTGTPPPTKKHSFVIALDLLDHINAYADAHHIEIKAVLDLALRRFFAEVGPEVRRG